jgi:hypothetical protein
MDASNVSLKTATPTRCDRGPLLTGDAMNAKIHWAESRTPRLPLIDEAKTREILGDLVADGPVPQWQRLLANFPVAGKRLVAGVVSSRKSDQLSPTLQAQLDWVLARQDGAWYLTALAMRDLTATGSNPETISALDGDLRKEVSGVDARDRALLLVAKNLAASPIVLTDRQVAQAVEIAGPMAVTQVINYTCYRAALNRITEAAGLSADVAGK